MSWVSIKFGLQVFQQHNEQYSMMVALNYGVI
jgi:hypothetical protein